MPISNRKTSRIKLNGKSITVPGRTLSYKKVVELVGGDGEAGGLYHVTYHRPRPLGTKTFGGTLVPGRSTAMTPGMVVNAVLKTVKLTFADLLKKAEDVADEAKQDDMPEEHKNDGKVVKTCSVCSHTWRVHPVEAFQGCPVCRNRK